ncbi:MAG: hypothetical protein HOW73_13245 [Polyangiaceae bacterium]|nr:hypothetical protein [Polyangiaceae bacterium]
MRRAWPFVFAGMLACSDEGTGGGATGGTHAGGAPGSGGVPSTSSATTDDATTTVGGAPTTSSGGAGGEASFELQAHTETDASPGLILRVNLPHDVASCRAIEGAPCEDLDADSIPDAWEAVLLDRLRPIQRFDEDEPLIDDETAVLGDVGRVFKEGSFVRAFIMLGYHKDYGSCGFTAHNGDSERVALELEPIPDAGAGDVRVRQAYTAAHEGTSEDHGRVFQGADLSQLVIALDTRTGEPRWVVFPSSAKHGTYATIDICEDVSSIPCFDEDCGPDGVMDPSMYDRLPPIVNAGEEAAPMVSDLSVIGFPGDDAWAVQDFCGGLGGSGCSDDVRNKLLNSPF